MKESKNRWNLQNQRHTTRQRSEGHYDNLKRELKPHTIVESGDSLIEELESQKKFRELIDKVKKKLEEDHKKLQEGRSNSTEVQTKSRPNTGYRGNFGIGSDDYRKECFILRDKIEKLQKNFNFLQIENEKIKRASDIRQETFIRREERFRRKEKELKKKLLQATTFHRGLSDDAEQMRQRKLLLEKKRIIQKGITKLQGEASELVSKKDEQYKNQLREMERQFQLSLEEERKKNYSEEKDFIEKSRLLKKLLEEFRKKAEDLDERNMKLEDENLKLRISYDAQKDNDLRWAKLNTKYKKENEKLRKMLGEQTHKADERKRRLNDMKIDVKMMKNGFKNYKKSEERNMQMDFESISKIGKELEKERRNFKLLKASYIDLLSERTELEIFLKQAIRDVIDSKRRLKMKNGLVEMDENVRKRVIELLLSKEQVLMKLYEKTFPFKGNFEKLKSDTTHEVLINKGV